MDAAEAAGYLHWPEEALTEETLDLLRKIGGKLEREAEPRLVYRIFDRTEDGCEGLCLPGEDIRTLLGDAKRVIVAACTLGEAASRFIRRAFLTDMARGVMADACASALADGEMARFERDMARRFFPQGLYLTDRFSPGYGDLPLTVQKDLCALLDTERNLGLTVNKSMMLVPEKSVTAVMGICPVPQKHRAVNEKSGCASCAAHENCVFLRGGRTCHG